jgi:hypothetical protein
MEHSLRVDVGGNSTTAINAGNLVPLSGTRKNTTAGLGELRWARRAGVSAVASSAEIAHGKLRRIIRHDKPARCFLFKRLVHLTYPVPTQSLFYTSSPSSSGSASTTLLAITFSFSQQQQTTKQTHNHTSASSHQQHQKQPHSLRHYSRYRITRASPAPSKLKLQPLTTRHSIINMRSFQTIVALLFAFVAFALAQEPSYDATVYVTSTVYRVNTVTLSGTPSASVANSTSTIAPSVASVIPSYGGGNGTAVAPTGVAPSSSLPVAPSSSLPAFTGAASHLNVNALTAALVAGVAYLAL